jgi:hypothetical protein
MSGEGAGISFSSLGLERGFVMSDGFFFRACCPIAHPPCIVLTYETIQANEPIHPCRRCFLCASNLCPHALFELFSVSNVVRNMRFFLTNRKTD